MEALIWLQETAAATWVRESVSLWAYPTQIALHAVGMALLVGLNAMVNLRVLGVASSVPLAAFERVFPAMWAAFALNLISGTLLTIAYAERLLVHPVFLTKLAALLIALVLLVLLRRWVFADSQTQVSVRGRVVAGLSLGAWIVTLVAGRLTAYDILLAGGY